MTIGQWVEHCRQALEEAGVHYGHGTDNAWDEAAWMVLHVLGLTLDGSFTRWEQPVDAAAADRIAACLRERIGSRRPLAYLLGEAWFCGLKFKVNDAVLVPRSPLAELIRDRFQPWLRPDQVRRVLDLCTGSGCIAIATATYMPGVEVDAVDISPAALEMAKVNAELHGVSDRVRFIESDVFAELSGQRYDLIVSNPPYVSDQEFAQLPSEYGWEPSVGLRANEDGLEIAMRILQASVQHLSRDGVLICEVGEAAERLQARLPQVPFTWLEFAHGAGGVFTIDRQTLMQTGLQSGGTMG